MPYSVVLLGVAGLIPFLAMPIAYSLNLLSLTQSAIYFMQYSAVLLSFFGGIHWYQAICEPKNSHQLYVAMLPSISAWLSMLIFDIKITLFVLSVSHLLILMYDKHYLRLPKQLVIAYTKMRLILTTIVIVCHFLMIWSV